MRKIINNKLYNTETAQLVGEYDNGLGHTDFSYISEELYRKRTGEYFVHGEGGPMTRYAESCGDGWTFGESITPVSYDTARQWAENHMDVDDYQQAFGEVSEGDGERVTINVSISVAAKARIDRECSKTGDTQAEVVERALTLL